nr:ClbS/DfsB family four-helix bundle protein [Neobacillus niacini]
MGKNQDVTLNFALKKLKLSHERVMNLIKLHTNEEIMTKKYYKWTSNHYIWAIKKCEFIAKFIEGGIKH